MNELYSGDSTPAARGGYYPSFPSIRPEQEESSQIRRLQPILGLTLTSHLGITDQLEKEAPLSSSYSRSGCICLVDCGKKCKVMQIQGLEET